MKLIYGVIQVCNRYVWTDEKGKEIKLNYAGYDKRTSVERENGRLDRDYGFELHTIRGKEKIERCITMAFLVQLSMAKGKIKQNKKER